MKAWLIALALSRGLDATSSCAAFARGAVESNPLLPTNCAATVSLQSGIAAGQIVALAALSKSHPRVAKTLAAVTITVEVGVSVHNWKVR